MQFFNNATKHLIPQKKINGHNKTLRSKRNQKKKKEERENEKRTLIKPEFKLVWCKKSFVLCSKRRHLSISLNTL